MRILIIIINLICLLQLALGQTFHKTYWHFGSTNVGLYFDTAGNPPTITNNSYTPYTNEGCSVYNDPITGDLKFYTDGLVVVDANGDPMPNGTGLQGNISCFGSGKIAVDPANCNRIYVFHNSADMSFNTLGNVKYTVVDVTLAGNGSDLNPLGDVVAGEKNIQIVSGMGEGMELVPQSGTRNYWLLLTKNTSQTIEVYHFDESGISYASTVNLPGELTDMRAFKFSPNYDRAIVSSLREDESTVIMDFDPVTGVISNTQLMPGTPLGNNNGWYGIFDVEWSSDGTKAYLSKYRDSSPAAGGKLYQYDFNTPADPPTLIHQISNSSTNLGRGLRRGPDDKIYWIYHNPITNSVQYIAAVNDPNQADAACDFEAIALDALTNMGGVHLFPTFIEFQNRAPEAIISSISHTVSCDNLNEPISIALNTLLTDPDGDLTIIDLISCSDGVITVESDTILLNPPPGFEGNIDVHIEFCDNYCYPLCGEHDFTIDIVMDNNTNSDVLPDEILQCGIDPAIIDPSLPDYDLIWSTGETTNTISVEDPGVYWFSASNAFGCVVEDTVQITFFDFPELLVAEEILLCDEVQVTLQTEVTDALLEWSTGESTNAITVDETGLYELEASWDNGCSLSDEVFVQFQMDGQSADILLDSFIVCGSDTYELELDLEEFDVIWNTGDTELSIIVTETGMYSVEASNDFGCVIMDTTWIDFFDVPEILVLEDIITCQPDIVLETDVTDAALEWSTGETTASIEISTSDEYTLQATFTNGCVINDTVTVLIEEFTIDLGGDQMICEGQSITLTVQTTNDAGILWNTTDTSSSISITEEGLYSVTVTNPEGCTASDAVNLEVLEYPVINLGNDTSICEPSALLISLTEISGVSYQWNTGEVGSSISCTETGIYQVTATNAACATSDEIEVVVNPLPDNPFGQSRAYCFEQASEPVYLNAANEGSQYIWSTGETTQSISVNTYGMYTVLITTEASCTASYSTEITMECPGAIYIPNCFTPDGDGINDYWFVSGYNFENFHVRIFNRWGELFWESTNPNIPWLGQRLSDGQYFVQDNVYTYLVTCTFKQNDDSLDEIQEFRGHITIIR